MSVEKGIIVIDSRAGGLCEGGLQIAVTPIKEHVVCTEQLYVTPYS